MKLTMPYPPGTNTLYGVRATMVRGRPMAFPYKTHEHRDYVVQARLAVLEAGLTAAELPRWPKPATLAMVVRLYRPRRAGDIDGPLKTLLDVLQGLAFDNDDQVARLEVYRHDDKHRPRVELEVTELAAEQPTLLDLGLSVPVSVKAAQAVPSAQALALPEPLSQRLRRLAKPAVIKSDPEAA